MKIITWNIANAKRDETEYGGQYKFSKRYADIIKFLKGENADIVCLQEIRQCTKEDGSVWTPEDIMDDIKKELGMNYKYTANNTSSSSFYRATYYKKETLFPIEETTVWTGANKEVPSGLQWCQCIFITKFIVLAESAFINGEYKDGKIISIWNCHAPLSLEGRIKYSERIVEHYTKTDIMMRGLCLMLGDFNSINEEKKDPQATDPVRAPVMVPLIPQMDPMKLLEERLTNVSGDIKQTFYSFPYDTSKTGERYISKLDHVLANKKEMVMGVNVADMSKTQWSDHFPLIVIL